MFKHFNVDTMLSPLLIGYLYILYHFSLFFIYIYIIIEKDMYMLTERSEKRLYGC